MKKYLLIGLVVLLCNNGFAQQETIDSLKAALKTARHDTTRLIIYSLIVETEPDYRKWLSYNEQIKHLTDQNLPAAKGKLKIFYSKYAAIYLNNLAYAHENNGEVEKALEYYDRSLKISQRIHDQQNISNTLNNIGYVYKYSGRITLALEYYHRSLEIKHELKDQKGEATLLNNIGIIYHSQGDVGRALEYYQKSLRIRETLNDKSRMSGTLNGIGGVYESQGDTALALSYYRKSLKIKQELGDRPGAVTPTGNIGGIFKSMGDTVMAMRYFQEQLKIAREVNLKHAIALALNNIGAIYNLEGKLQKALDCFEESIRIRTEIEDRQGLANSYTNAGSVYEKMDRLAKAIDYYHKSLDIGRTIGFTDNIRKASERLYNIYKKQGNAAKALAMHELYMQMKDSINNDNTRKAVFKSQFKYEYEKKAATDSIRALEEKKRMQNEKELMQAKIENEETKRYALLAGIVALLVLAFFIVQRIRLRQKVKELRIRNKIASDLHDEVGSALSSISLLSGMAGMQGGAQHQTIKRIESTSRETLENMSDIVWSIQPRNDKLTDVVNRMHHYGQQLFTSLGIGFEFSRQSEISDLPLNMEQRKSLYLIYKEALNNAAKYAGADQIRVTISNRSRLVVLVISDNGKGFDPGVQAGGNGLYTMQERARNLNGTLDIASIPGTGTTITLQFKTT